MDFKVATFNVFNLVKQGVPFYGRPPYSQNEYEQKKEWTANRLRALDADVVGFQEVFHEDSLQEFCIASELYTEDQVKAPATDGASPRVGIASRLPFEVGPPITDFPAGLDFSSDTLSLQITKFSRPVLRAQVELPNNDTCVFFVAHLKSKRPKILLGEDPDDFLVEALGSARSLIQRAAEATALRALILAEVAETEVPLILLGDLNDGVSAVTNEILSGSPPWKFAEWDEKTATWDRLLYSAYELQTRRSLREVGHSHIFNGRYDTLDHVYVSQEFYDRNPARIGRVEYARILNDQLVDETLTEGHGERVESDHGQLVATLSLR